MRFWRRREEELEGEIQDYLERETREYIDSGMSPADARNAARQKLGHAPLWVRETTREVWGWIWLERLWQDIRYGARLLVKEPSFTLVAVTSLAIGIGANSAIFSFADAVLLRPLPVSRPSEIVTIGSVSPTGIGQVSYRDYVDFRDRNRSFDGLVAFTDHGFGFSRGTGDLPQIKTGLLVSANLFDVMGVAPELGRAFRPEEGQVPGRDAVVVLSHGLWEKEFGSDPSVVGRKLRLNGLEFTVIGVAPGQFTGLNQYLRPAFYVPILMAPRLAGNDRLLEDRSRRELLVKGRLRKGVSLDEARSELGLIAKQLEQSYPETNRKQAVVTGTEFETRVYESPPDAQLVGMLAALAAAVLLVACANVASLLLARANSRVREMSLRLAVGAGRARLVRQLLTESLVIAAAGGSLGLLIGYGGVKFLNRIPLVPGDYPIVISFELDRRALLFSAAISLCSAILFGLAPAIQTTRADLATALRTGIRGEGLGRRLWGRSLLVVGQVGACVVLLVCATALYRGFGHYLIRNPGFRTDHVLKMSFDPELVRYTEPETQQFYRQLVERAKSVPGVRLATLAETAPMDGGDVVTLVPEGFQFPPDKVDAQVFANTVDPGYFETMAVDIVRGRGFLAADTATSLRVAVVNEQFARHFWPGQEPLGKRFRLDGPTGAWVEIVGLTETGKYTWIGEPPTEFVYFPASQQPRPRMTLLVLSAGDPASLAMPLRQVVHDLDPNQPVYNVRTMEDFYQKRAVNAPNLVIELVGTLALVGLAMALVGLYGLLSYSVRGRTREIGIRMAIGAKQGAVVRMVLRQGLTLVLVGAGIGLVASLGAERVLMAIFSGTEHDFAAYLVAAPLLLLTALLAAYLPARRASHVDPAATLRHE